MWEVIADFIQNKRLGYQSGNKLKNNIVALASMRRTFHLGGSRTIGLPLSAAAQDAQDYIDVEIDGTQLVGFTAKLRVEVKTDNAGTSVTPKLRNLTTAADAGTGAASTATLADYSGTNQKQSIAVTLATGVNKYRLMLTAGNATDAVYGIGYLEIYADA